MGGERFCQYLQCPKNKMYFFQSYDSMYAIMGIEILRCRLILMSDFADLFPVTLYFGRNTHHILLFNCLYSNWLCARQLV